MDILLSVLGFAAFILVVYIGYRVYRKRKDMDGFK